MFKFCLKCKNLKSHSLKFFYFTINLFMRNVKKYKLNVFTFFSYFNLLPKFFHIKFNKKSLFLPYVFNLNLVYEIIYYYTFSQNKFN